MMTIATCQGYSWLRRNLTSDIFRLSAARRKSFIAAAATLFIAAAFFPSAANAVVNCAAKPSACGYPDATNTGPAPTIQLKRIPEQVRSGAGWHWDSRGWVVIDGNGAVFSGFITDGEISVQADNVTIRNCVITTGGMFGIAIRHADNLTIANCKIGPPLGETRLMAGIKDIYGDSVGTRIARNNFSNTGTAIQIERGYINDNYIHDMGIVAGDHINGITSNGSTQYLEIRHNTIFNQIGQTDAIGLFQDFGLQANRLIYNNLIAGGGYTLYAGQNPGKAATYNIVVQNNRFSNRFFLKAGYYGPATAHNKYGSGNQWSNNVWDHNNALISAP